MNETTRQFFGEDATTTTLPTTTTTTSSSSSSSPSHMTLAADIAWTVVFSSMITSAIVGNMVVFWIVLGKFRISILNWKISGVTKRKIRGLFPITSPEGRHGLVRLSVLQLFLLNVFQLIVECKMSRIIFSST